MRLIMKTHSKNNIISVVKSLSLIIIFSSLILSQQNDAPIKKLYIAVMDFAARDGVSSGEAASLSDLFSAQMVATEEFTIVDRSRIKNILEEQGFQQSEACSD